MTLAAKPENNHRGAAYLLVCRAKDMSPASPDVLNTLGLCFVALGRYREAIAAYDTAIGLGPKHGFLHSNKGVAHYDLGEPQQARRELEKTFAIEPAHAEGARTSRARPHFGRVRTCSQVCRALALAPRHEAMLALATVDIEEGKFAEAQTRLEPFLADEILSPLYRSSGEIC